MEGASDQWIFWWCIFNACVVLCVALRHQLFPCLPYKNDAEEIKFWQCGYSLQLLWQQQSACWALPVQSPVHSSFLNIPLVISVQRTGSVRQGHANTQRCPCVLELNRQFVRCQHLNLNFLLQDWQTDGKYKSLLGNLSSFIESCTPASVSSSNAMKRTH